MQYYLLVVFVLIVFEWILLLTYFTWILNPIDVSAPSANSTLHLNLNFHIFKPLKSSNKIKIGLIKPAFTDAAYNNKFYSFYSKFSNLPFNTNVTKDLSLLNSKVSNIQRGAVHNVFALSDLVKNIQNISNKTKSFVLSDVDVDKGDIFTNITSHKLNLFDILVLGHQEYVTQQEYDNLKQFVFNGGTMILLDGNVFYAEVKYFENNNTISLVRGHGWAYNGKTAWRSVDERWKNETRQWVGSNYLCYLCIKSFKNNPFGYLPHEEQYITNSNDSILFNFDPIELPNAPKSNISIAMYALNYGKGKVVSFGIYSDDVIKNIYFNNIFRRLIESFINS